MSDYEYFKPMGRLSDSKIVWPSNQAPLNEIRAKLWIEAKRERPGPGEIVWMYSKENNEFSVGHFVLERSGVRVTHWQPLIGPKDE